MSRESQWIKEHLARKRAKGLCAYGGCHEQSGEARYCPAHSEKHAQWTRDSKMRKRTTDELIALRDKHLRSAHSAQAELIRRKKVSP